MKKYLSIWLIFLAGNFPILSQDSINTKITKRYRIDLIEEFMKPKILSAIVDILSETILELKDLEASSSPKADYFVRFIIDSFASNISTIPVAYHFKAVLRVYDSTGDPVSQLLIVSPEEIFETNSVKKLINFQQYYSYEEVNVYDESGRYIIGTVPALTPTTFSPEVYTVPNALTYSLIPNEDLVNICKRKILRIRKMVRQLKESGRL